MIVDVFLSRKSEDALLAKQLYDFLIGKGVKVFDSDHSLQEVGNADYSRAIDDALIGTKHLIVIGSSADHISSPWVEAEWRFFLNRKRAGKVKGNILTVVSSGLSIDDLPPSLQNYEVIPLEPRYYERIYAYVRPSEPIAAQPEPPKPQPITPAPDPVMPAVAKKTSTPPAAKATQKRKPTSRSVASVPEPQTPEPDLNKPLEAVVEPEKEATPQSADRQAKYDVFISYSSKDTVTADALLNSLEADGIRCWIAPRNVQPGKAWTSSILDGIREANVFVLIFSARSNQSKRVHKEVEQATALGKSVVMYRTEDILPSGVIEFHLSSDHWIHAVKRPLSETVPALINAIRPLMTRHPAPDQTLKTTEPVGSEKEVASKTTGISVAASVTEKQSVHVSVGPTAAEVITWRERGIVAYNSSNFSEALLWFRKAAEQGDAEAQSRLGYMYYDGRGVSPDYKEGTYWIRKAAELSAKNSLKEKDKEIKSLWQRLFG